ncbi:MAG TPA: (2Fe-2S) ferredoxin domain-containing protein [Candidatus Saccharimonadales bacterium]|nr:(2Fe-2S) ferredoxin domain-containing protein [Candidatus Saccharimonadales bacterium]
MENPKHHIFVCASFRIAGETKGACHRKDSSSLLGYLQSELSDRGMDEVMVSSTGCLNRCEKGPLMVIYPEGHWYGEINEEKIDEVLDALADGEPATSLLLH